MIIKIDKTNISPDIIFDLNMNVINITGRLILENAISYFIDITDHLELFDDNNITLNIDVDYINSSSLSQLLKMIRNHPKIIIINWYYPEHDYDSRKTGEIFQKMLTNIEINIIVKYD